MKKQVFIAIITSIVLTGTVSFPLQASTLEFAVSKIQEIEKKVDTVEIKTSAICGMCKERLEHDMTFEKGVKSVELDLDTKILTISYKTNKTSKEELKKAVTKIGYDADEMVANQKAHDRLPPCCQKGTEPH